MKNRANTTARIKRLNKQAGFTLIELMIATTFFAMVLTVMLAAFLQIGRMYYKGISVDNTYEAARTVMNDIEGDTRFGSDVTYAAKPTPPGNIPNQPVPSNPNAYYFCIGQHRYTYVLSNSVSSVHKIGGTDITNPDPKNNPQGIIQDIVSGCPPPSTPGSAPTQLLSANMQLNDLDFYCTSVGCYVHVHIILYGADNTVFASSANPNNPARALLDKDNYCSGNLLSTDYCAAADLASSVDLGD